MSGQAIGLISDFCESFKPFGRLTACHYNVRILAYFAEKSIILELYLKNGLLLSQNRKSLRVPKTIIRIAFLRTQ